MGLIDLFMKRRKVSTDAIDEAVVKIEKYKAKERGLSVEQYEAELAHGA